MLKNKIVGFSDLLLGLWGIVLQVPFLLIVYPKLSSLYSQFNAELPITTRLIPYLSFLVLLISICSLYVGVKIFKTDKENKKLFAFGVILLIIMAIWALYGISLFVVGSILPIYNSGAVN